ncbi:hypothetical protein BD779DRAFT_510911 [Infundibulicybe gibba]|nr:hypothetical protein BD779DRAFT_510911 [Infundibulicybe gibba]
MSLSPKLDPTSSVLAPYSPPINPQLSPGSTVPDARLSSLLTEAYNNVDILRRENLSLRERAEKADRIFKSLQALPSPSNSNPPSSGSPTLQHPEVARLLLEYEDRARRAEQARDEADARRRMLADNWVQLDRYLANIELRAADARTGYARAVAEASNPIITGPSGVGISTSNSMPPPSSRHRGTPVFPALTLPPLPNANSVSNKVRPRAGSLDGSYVNQPPSKKPRSERDERRGREERAIFTESQSPHLHSAHTPHQYAESREREYQPATSSARLSRHHLTPNHGQARMIMPGNDRPRSPSSRSPRSRSSSRSRDERNGGAHAATNGNGNGNAAGQAGLSPPANAPPIHRHRHHRHRDRSPSRHSHGHTHSSHTHSHASIHPEDLASRQYQLIQQQQQRLQQQSQLSDTYAQPGTAYRPRAHTSTGIPSGPGADNAAAAAAGPLAQPGQVQTYQTHVFAPVVTGAPVKKSKFPVGGSGSTVAVGAPTTVGSGPVDTPPAAPPASSFPATNASGQRICRQCGMAGRYKDGKCVEKWGPGPMGPGTVCDR